MNRSIHGNGKNMARIWTSAMFSMNLILGCMTLLSIIIALLMNSPISQKLLISTWSALVFGLVLHLMLQLLGMEQILVEWDKHLFTIDLLNRAKKDTN